MNPLLDVKNLYVRFKTPDGVVTAVNDLNFTLNAGSTLGIVGESGSGKSQTAFALMGLLAANGEVEGSAIFEGKELVNLPNAELNKIRAEQISMIFQDPMTSLDPTMKVGMQVAESMIKHLKLSKKEALQQAVLLLEQVGIPNAEKRVNDYPHQFSGGQRQRIVIAIALACNPDILIADEPTGNLDPETSMEIMDILERINQQGTTIVMATHNSQIVNEKKHRVLAIEMGRIVRDQEEGEYGYED